jgi:Protein of unknown function (DUF3071)
MQDLQLVGVHEDGEHVLLKGADGQRYRLAIDEPLRAAARRDRARLGQLQIEIQGHVRPRDIQARIRSGETAEDIALTSGLPVEHVRRYEGPVLAEREHVAFRAQRQVVRSAGAGRGPELATLVSERLAARGVEGGVWDAWRREDGIWTVQLAFRAGSKDRRARWTYDLVSGALEAVDDEARWLCAAKAADEGPVPARRLASVKERVYDVEADGGVRESQQLGAHQHGAADDDAAVHEEPAAAPDTTALLEELRERRGRRQPVKTPEEMADEDDDRAPVGPSPAGPSPVSQAPAAHPPASTPSDATDAEILALPELAQSDGDVDVVDVDADVVDGHSTATGAQTPAPVSDDGSQREAASGKATATKTARRQSKARRPSVPSWDEIVFGARKE